MEPAERIAQAYIVYYLAIYLSNVYLRTCVLTDSVNLYLSLYIFTWSLFVCVSFLQPNGVAPLNGPPKPI